jgi:hypothetical protein
MEIKMAAGWEYDEKALRPTIDEFAEDGARMLWL